jgi:FtsP/CotA-like multicopper oxidase with cupredoxin domain
MFINDGHVAMVDGALVYMRGFGDAATGDPRPSLTITPTVFQAGAAGPVASRFYPLVGPDRLPEEGVPASAGADPAGGNLIFRRHWASFFPDRTIVAEAGADIRLRITNRLRQEHAFKIDGVVHETFGPAGSPTATKDVAFPAPAPGTYIYHDPTDAPVNRILGLHGVLVVVPAANAWSFDGREGEFERQWLWLFNDIDPEWGRRIQAGGTVDPTVTPALPRYFTLNDRAGVYSLAASPDPAINRRTLEDLLPGGHLRRIDVRDFSDPHTGTGQLIRVANAGVAIHQPHWHGNHVWTIAVDNAVQPRGSITMSSDGHPRVQLWEDVVEIDPMSTKAVMLPVKRPPEVLQEVLDAQVCEYEYPMHCHAEMSQSAAGGLYPGGQVTGWRLRR